MRYGLRIDAMSFGAGDQRVEPGMAPAAASLPAKSQFFLPDGHAFQGRSAALLSMFRKPCSCSGSERPTG